MRSLQVLVLVEPACSGVRERAVGSSSDMDDSQPLAFRQSVQNSPGDFRQERVGDNVVHGMRSA